MPLSLIISIYSAFNGISVGCETAIPISSKSFLMIIVLIQMACGVVFL
jgi:hypothetical protein